VPLPQVGLVVDPDRRHADMLDRQQALGPQKPLEVFCEAHQARVGQSQRVKVAGL
jgi:hypothetical protein